MDKSFTKKHSWIFLFLAASLLLFVMLFSTGCEKKGTGQEELSTQSEATILENQSLTATPYDKGIDFQINQLQQIDYYSVNPETFETEAVQALVKGDLSDDPQELMKIVLDSLEDAGYEVDMRKVSIEDQKVVVDFFHDGFLLVPLQKQEEKAILDAIAQSLLDNLSGSRGVVFRLMGEEYQSDNFSFGREDVYMKN